MACRVAHLRVLVLALACSAITSTAFAAPVFSDDFDSDTQGLNATPSGFNIISGSVDVIGTGYYDYHPGNGNYLDLDGSDAAGTDNPASDIATTMSFGPGTYTVSFSLAGAEGGSTESTEVEFGSFSQTYAPDAGSDFATQTFTTTLTASSHLEFVELGVNTNNGNLLDNVTVSLAGGMSAVPLPSSAPMFGAALLALGAAGFAARRKKAAATA